MATFGRKNRKLTRMTSEQVAASAPSVASDKSLNKPDELKEILASANFTQSLEQLESELQRILASRGRGRPSKDFLNKKSALESAINQARYERYGDSFIPIEQDETFSLKVKPLEESPATRGPKRRNARSVDSFVGPGFSVEETSASKPVSQSEKEKQPAKRRPGRPRKNEAERRSEPERKTPHAQEAQKQEAPVVPSEGELLSTSTPREEKPSRPEKQERLPRRERKEISVQDLRERAGSDRANKRSARRFYDIAPKLSKEDLRGLELEQLYAYAQEFKVDPYEYGDNEELIEAIYHAAARAEGFIDVEGILDVLPEGYGFIRTRGYLPTEDDVYIAAAMIKKNGLRKGDYLTGVLRPIQGNEKYPALHQVKTVLGRSLDEVRSRPRFGDLTPIYPTERLKQEHGKNSYTGRCIDLLAPIGKGQRGLIVSPPKAGKTTILKKIAESVAANNPEVHLMCLLVDERPEEVTDMRRSIKGEVIASTFDMPSDQHIAVAELVIERAKRLVEIGEDVVILLDSITRLARAYNLAQPASGRILSGGVDSTALYPPKRFLGAARNIEHGGSLTILASALIDTGSKMDEVIFEEFKGTGNMELKLDRDLADRRIFPAIDPVASGTRQEDLLIGNDELPFIWGIRRVLANYNNVERAMTMLIKSLTATNNNSEFLLRSAKKAQQGQVQEGMLEL